MTKSTSSARIVLEDGLVLHGLGFGACATASAEVVFNTSMSGYQEILTDPSYAGQIVTMSSSQMGNVGACKDDEESARPHAVGMIIRQLSPVVSNYRAQESLHDYLERFGVAGISDIDTRQLVRHLRTHGAMRGVISTESVSDAALVDLAKTSRSMAGLDLASALSTRAPYVWSKASYDISTNERGIAAAAPKFKVAAYDYGLKHAMLELLVDAGCDVTVVPAAYPAHEVLSGGYHGVFLTNGPGDPSAVPGAREQVAALIGKLPIMGICLGHQILALAAGAETYKMKFGHRGGNQPVLNIATGKVDITSQNHGFAVDEHSLPAGVVVTHKNLNDKTVEGIAIPDAHAFSVQHHPESSPGPHDARDLFGQFVVAMSHFHGAKGTKSS